MKTYGRLTAENLKDPAGHVPFIRNGLDEPLKVAACVRCHNEEGWLARGTLTRQQFMSIGFLVQSGQMPPPGFALSSEERAEVLEFAGVR